jgi:hypothetical protein
MFTEEYTEKHCFLNLKSRVARVVGHGQGWKGWVGLARVGKHSILENPAYPTFYLGNTKPTRVGLWLVCICLPSNYALGRGHKSSIARAAFLILQ